MNYDIRHIVMTADNITEFQRKVYLAVLEIPRGKTVTYKQLADKIGCKSCRAVGQALRENPFAPDVPCHRVVASDGKIGGYLGETSGEMIERKRQLLEQERNVNKVKITAIRQTVYPDLMEKYENKIEHQCDVREGQQWISEGGQCPDGMCESAWESMRTFVESLSRGEGNFFDGWMQNPMSAMISCNDGFRPFSFYIEVVE